MIRLNSKDVIYPEMPRCAVWCLRPLWRRSGSSWGCPGGWSYRDPHDPWWWQLGAVASGQMDRLGAWGVRDDRVRGCSLLAVPLNSGIPGYLWWMSLLGLSLLSLSFAHLNFIPDRVTTSLIHRSSRTESGSRESRSSEVFSRASTTWSEMQSQSTKNSLAYLETGLEGTKQLTFVEMKERINKLLS